MSEAECHVCGDQTFLACSDCRINFTATVWVCKKSSCRDEHEKLCAGDGHKVLIPRPKYEALMAGMLAIQRYLAGATSCNGGAEIMFDQVYNQARAAGIQIEEDKP